MNIAVLPNGVYYNIPLSDVAFFKELADRMKWQIIDNMKQTGASPAAKSWVDGFAGKWQDTRSTDQIVNDIHAARTPNSEILL